MKKILIVDDEYSVREMVSSSVRNFTDYVVDVASDGFAAVKKVMSEDFGLVVIDITMPKMNGIDAIKAMKIIKKDLPIIIITGYASEVEKQKGLEAGAIEVITKPFSIKKMIEKINRYVEKEDSCGTAQTSESVKEGEKIIFLASAAGGPSEIARIMSKLKKETYPPVVILQHMPPGFISVLHEGLKEQTSHVVKIAEEGDVLEQNTIYISRFPEHFCLCSGRVSYDISCQEKVRSNHPDLTIGSTLAVASLLYKGNSLMLALQGICQQENIKDNIRCALDNGSQVYALSGEDQDPAGEGLRNLLGPSVSIDEAVSLIDTF